MQFKKVITLFITILIETTLSKDTTHLDEQQPFDSISKHQAPPTLERQKRHHNLFRQPWIPYGFPQFPREHRPGNLFPNHPSPQWFHPHFPTHPGDFSLFPTIPDFSVVIPMANESSYDVEVINGITIETNRTVTEGEDENGQFVEEVRVVRYYTGQEEDTGDSADRAEEGDQDVDEASTPEYVGFGIPPVSLKRNRRWAAGSNFLQKLMVALRLKKSQDKSSSTQPPSTPESRYRSLEGDTRVNYINNNNDVETDAEIFDPNRFKENRRESLAENVDNEISTHSHHSAHHSRHPISERISTLSNRLTEKVDNEISTHSHHHHNSRHPISERISALSNRLTENVDNEMSTHSHPISERMPTLSNHLAENPHEGISRGNYYHTIPKRPSNQHRRPSFEHEENENGLLTHDANDYTNSGYNVRSHALRYRPRSHHKLHRGNRHDRNF